MPAGDGSGPEGMGPMTGRGAGLCAGSGMPGYANPMPGRGFGMGRGRGRGRRNRFYATGVPGRGRFGYAPAWAAPPVAAYGPYAAPSPEQEVEFLKAQAGQLQQQLDAIGKRIEALEQE